MAAQGGATPAAAARPRLLKAHLARGGGLDGPGPHGRLYGAFVMSNCPLVAELMGCCGYDFLVVDMEHSPAGVGGALAMLQAVRAAGIACLLRVPVNKPEVIKKALDLGPEGLVVPLVSSAEEARLAAAACRYPPEGVRGVAYPMVRAARWGLDAGYGEGASDRHLLLCQVETREAIEDVDAILGVDGVDGVFLGPLDLSASLGRMGQPGHPDVAAALARVEAAAARRPEKVLAGFAGGRAPADMFASGYHMVACATDVTMLRDAARADVAAAAADRGELGGAAPAGPLRQRRKLSETAAGESEATAVPRLG